MLVLLAAVTVLGAAPIDTYRALTRAEVVCDRPNGEEVVVCARRDADRYRVPLVLPTPGDPKAETASEERERLQAKVTPCRSGGPFLIGCGMVGVHMTAGGGRSGPELRPLAP
jgi:hypothetical protein